MGSDHLIGSSEIAEIARSSGESLGRLQDMEWPLIRICLFPRAYLGFKHVG